jgi:hypothetical protein
MSLKGSLYLNFYYHSINRLWVSIKSFLLDRLNLYSNSDKGGRPQDTLCVYNFLDTQNEIPLCFTLKGELL